MQVCRRRCLFDNKPSPMPSSPPSSSEQHQVDSSSPSLAFSQLPLLRQQNEIVQPGMSTSTAGPSMNPLPRPLPRCNAPPHASLNQLTNAARDHPCRQTKLYDSAQSYLLPHPTTRNTSSPPSSSSSTSSCLATAKASFNSTNAASLNPPTRPASELPLPQYQQQQQQHQQQLQPHTQQPAIPGAWVVPETLFSSSIPPPLHQFYNIHNSCTPSAPSPTLPPPLSRLKPMFASSTSSSSSSSLLQPFFKAPSSPSSSSLSSPTVPFSTPPESILNLLLCMYNLVERLEQQHSKSNKNEPMNKGSSSSERLPLNVANVVDGEPSQWQTEVVMLIHLFLHTFPNVKRDFLQLLTSSSSSSDSLPSHRLPPYHPTLHSSFPASDANRSTSAASDCSPTNATIAAASMTPASSSDIRPFSSLASFNSSLSNHGNSSYISNSMSSLPSSSISPPSSPSSSVSSSFRSLAPSVRSFSACSSSSLVQAAPTVPPCINHNQNSLMNLSATMTAYSTAAQRAHHCSNSQLSSSQQLLSTHTVDDSPRCCNNQSHRHFHQEQPPYTYQHAADEQESHPRPHLQQLQDQQTPCGSASCISSSSPCSPVSNTTTITTTCATPALPSLTFSSTSASPPSLASSSSSSSSSAWSTRPLWSWSGSPMPLPIQDYVSQLSPLSRRCIMRIPNEPSRSLSQLPSQHRWTCHICRHQQYAVRSSASIQTHSIVCWLTRSYAPRQLKERSTTLDSIKQQLPPSLRKRFDTAKKKKASKQKKKHGHAPTFKKQRQLRREADDEDETNSEKDDEDSDDCECSEANELESGLEDADRDLDEDEGMAKHEQQLVISWLAHNNLMPTDADIQQGSHTINVNRIHSVLAKYTLPLQPPSPMPPASSLSSLLSSAATSLSSSGAQPSEADDELECKLENGEDESKQVGGSRKQIGRPSEAGAGSGGGGRAEQETKIRRSSRHSQPFSAAYTHHTAAFQTATVSPLATLSSYSASSSLCSSPSSSSASSSAVAASASTTAAVTTSIPPLIARKRKTSHKRKHEAWE